MRLAVLPRFIDLNTPNTPSTKKLYANQDFEMMANEFGVGIVTIVSQYGLDDICSFCDGLIIPGSSTGVNPKYYGGTPLANPQVFDEYALDSKLIDLFVKGDKPILGICAGHQALNIYFGGTIGYVTTDGTKPHSSGDHPVDIVPGSFVYDAFKTQKGTINSYHIMHTDKIGKDLEVVARSHDGIVEAFKHKTKNIFGVQWHPERDFTQKPENKELLKNFIECCKK